MTDHNKAREECQIKEGDFQVCEDKDGIYFKIHDRVLAAIGVSPGDTVDIWSDGPGHLAIKGDGPEYLVINKVCVN